MRAMASNVDVKFAWRDGALAATSGASGASAD